MLLSSKYSLPEVSDFVIDRSRLLEPLSQVDFEKVITVIAPAGFGKTTLLASYIANVDYPVAWYSLDENDNESSQFLHYLVESIHRATGNGIPRTRGVLESSKTVDLIATIGDMLEELRSFSEPLRIVFDDFHLIENEQVTRAVKFMLKHASTGISFALTSRSQPEIGLASIRLKGQLYEIQAQDLALTIEETADLLARHNDFDFEHAKIVQLQLLSEGWPPLVQLFALSVESADQVGRFLEEFEQGHTHLLDYLAEEVLERLGSEMRDVLQSTSVLSRVNEDIANRMSGRVDAGDLIREASRRGLFLSPLDSARNWYRYHPVFAKYLQRTISSANLKSLHSLACEQWLELKDPIQALHHALELKSIDRVKHILLEFGDELLLNGHYRSLGRCFQFIGDNEVVDTPQLALIAARIAQAQFAYDRVDMLLAACERNINRTDPDLIDQYGGVFATLRAQVAISKGDLIEAREYADEAIELVDPSSLDHAIASSVMGEAAFCLGKLDEALERMREIEKRARQLGDLPDTIWAICQQAEILYAQGELERSTNARERARDLVVEHNLENTPVAEFVYRLSAQQAWEALDIEGTKDFTNRGIAAARHLGESLMLQEYSLLANIALADADKDACLKWVDKLGRLLDHGEYHQDWVVNADYARLSIWEALGDLAEIERWLATVKPVSASPTNHFEQRHGRNVVRALTAVQRYSDANRLIRRLIRVAKKHRLVTDLNKDLVIKAYVDWQQGNRDESIEELYKALSGALKTGLRASFLRCGKPVILMLKQLMRVHELTEEEANLCKELIDLAQRHPEFDGRLRIELDPAVIDQLIQSDSCPEMIRRSPLTPREWQVLNLIHSGFSNGKIAEHFDVAPSTIKTHIRSVYQKIGVDDRQAAIALASDMLRSIQEA